MKVYYLITIIIMSIYAKNAFSYNRSFFSEQEEAQKLWKKRHANDQYTLIAATIYRNLRAQDRISEIDKGKLILRELENRNYHLFHHKLSPERTEVYNKDSLDLLNKALTFLSSDENSIKPRNKSLNTDLSKAHILYIQEAFFNKSDIRVYTKIEKSLEKITKLDISVYNYVLIPMLSYFNQYSYTDLLYSSVLDQVEESITTKLDLLPNSHSLSPEAYINLIFGLTTLDKTRRPTRSNFIKKDHRLMDSAHNHYFAEIIDDLFSGLEDIYYDYDYDGDISTLNASFDNKFQFTFYKRPSEIVNFVSCFGSENYCPSNNYNYFYQFTHFHQGKNSRYRMLHFDKYSILELIWRYLGGEHIIDVDILRGSNDNK